MKHTSWSVILVAVVAGCGQGAAPSTPVKETATAVGGAPVGPGAVPGAVPSAPAVPAGGGERWRALGAPLAVLVSLSEAEGTCFVFLGDNPTGASMFPAAYALCDDAREDLRHLVGTRVRLTIGPCAAPEPQCVGLPADEPLVTAIAAAP